MVDVHQWVCIHTAQSLPEAYLLRSVLELCGIQVCICEAPTTQHHDYLHDPQERVRVFIPAVDLAQGRRYTEIFLQTQQQTAQPPVNFTP